MTKRPAERPNPEYNLSGCISNPKGKLLEGLAVQAYEQVPKAQPNPLGKPALTDAQGRYQITFTDKDFIIGGVPGRGPDVFIRVYEGKTLLGESGVKRNYAAGRIKSYLTTFISE